MRLNRCLRIVSTGALLASAALAACQVPAGAAAPGDLTTLVNPFIGTQKDGNTFPGAALPFGMVQVSPDTGWGVGYNYDHPKIWGFSQTHLSGVGCASGTHVPLMPIVGNATTNNPTVYGQTLDHSREQASPGYYRLGMPNGVTAELTATLRTGWQRYTFPATNQATVLFNTTETRGHNGDAAAASISIVGSDTVEGSVTDSGFCSGTPEHTVYFSARFSRAFASFGTWSGGAFTTGSRGVNGRGTGIGGWARFDATADRTVTVKVGLSYTGVDGARRNLQGETGSVGFDFDAVRQAARDVWNDKLHRIEIDGGTNDRRVAFYTSLYHSLLHPNLAGDVDGRYRGFDNVVRTASGHTPYQTFSLWDTYRTQNQLVALLEPQTARDYGLSVLAAEQQLGGLPRWSMYNVETNTMTGDPVTPFLADLWSRGLLRGHEQAAYAALRRNALGTPPPTSMLNGRTGNPYHAALGYVPSQVNCGRLRQFEHDCQYPASATLEYAVADSALAIMAKSLGHAADAAVFQARGQSYRTLFDRSLGFFRPRDVDGDWITPYEPKDGRHMFHEAGPYQYQWLVPQDPAGLVDLLGGPDRANGRLDQFFAYPDLLTNPAQTARTKWVNGSYDYYSFTTYNPNNEPDLLAPYTYLWTNQPHKTATVVRAAYTLFGNAPNGVTGNDDLGTMSAWYVLSSLGLYPLMNGSNDYGVSTPQFARAQVTIGAFEGRQGGVLTISAPGVSDTQRYIASAALKGTPFTRTWLDHTEIAAGGALNFTVSAQPSSWGTGAGDAPPSVNRANPDHAALNVERSRPATGSTPCTAAEGPDRAVDGDTTGGNAAKFCSNASGAWLQVDLGSALRLGGVRIKHAGAGNESADYNTRAYTVQVSPNDTDWDTAVTVKDNTAGITRHQFGSSPTARFVRLNITAPTQVPGDTAARIYEFEIFADPAANLVRNRPATGSAPCAPAEGPEKAANGSVSGGDPDKFCSNAPNAWLQVDLGSSRQLSTLVVRHAGAGWESADYNTRGFTLQLSGDGSTWSTGVSVTANTGAVSVHPIAAQAARYLRLTVSTPTQSPSNIATRIYELEAYAG